MRKAFITFLFIISIVANTQAQKPSNTPYKKQAVEIDKEKKDNVTVIQDKRISMLVARHIQLNEKQKEIEGFRIRLFSDSGFNARHGAITLRTEFMKKYPEIATYLDYIEPFYKIYIGDFRTKIDAQKVYKKIRYEYPNAFIVKCKINFPPID